MIRPLNVMETYGALYNQVQAYNMSLAVRYPWVDEDTFLRAISQWQAKERCFQLNYGEDLCFYPIATPIPVEEIPAEKGKNSWLEWVRQEAHLHFSDPKQPLVRLKYRRIGDELEVIFSFSHVIADGLSSLLLIQSFEECLMGNWSGTIRAFENLLPTEKIPFKLPTKPLQNRSHFDLKHIQFDENKTKEILKQCREEGTTLHGFLSGLITQAYFQADQAVDTLKIRSQVNLRPYLKIPENVVGNYQTTFDYRLKNDGTTLWDVARAVRLDLRSASKEAGRPLAKLEQLAKVLQTGQLDFSVNEPTLSLSTLGVLPNGLGRVLGAATSHYAGPAPHMKVVSGIINGKLVMMFEYDEGLYGDGFFWRFSGALQVWRGLVQDFADAVCEI